MSGSGSEWTSSFALSVYQNGYEEGTRDAAEELMDRLRKAGVSDGDWNGGDVVEAVDSWLSRHGVDTSAERCGHCGTSFTEQGYREHEQSLREEEEI